MLRIKRVYDEPADADGYRVLVDRLWPRGVNKQRAAVDEWLKNVAPSPALRSWFNHELAKFPEFSRRYRRELEQNPALDDLLKLLRTHESVTLVYGARDPRVNHAAVLYDFMVSRL